MPMTPFRRRKIARMFDMMDMDGDGRVARSDFTRRVDALAGLRGWDSESPPYQRNLGFAIEEWEGLRESADADDNGRYAEVYLDDRSAIRAFARGDAQLLFDSMDADGDGKITLDEYRTYLQVCGLDPSMADAFFRHADLNEDGKVTRAEMAHAVEEYLTSEDPQAGGNFLFGPLES